MNEVTFLMLVGLPASGKSSFSEEIYENRDDIAYISSDAIREEMYGDIHNQDNNVDVFVEMADRTKKALKDGIHVIYDATNLSRKKRKGLLQQLPRDVYKTVVYLSSNLQTIKRQNSERKRVVPEYVIDRMYRSLQVPIYSEGWDNIVFHYDDETMNAEYPIQFADSIRLGVELNREGMELMNFLATYFNEFFDIHDLAQDSKWHSLSVSRHTYYVYKHVLDNYQTEDPKEKELMLWTALLHDTGKAFTKNFLNRKEEETRYANFIGHEFVSSQLAVNLLKRLGFNDEFIHNVATLIQLHMYLLDENANRQKLIGYVGEDLYNKLEFLREADTLAH